MTTTPDAQLLLSQRTFLVDQEPGRGGSTAKLGHAASGERIARSLASDIFFLEGKARAIAAENVALTEAVGALETAIAEKESSVADLVAAGQRKDEYCTTLAHELLNALAPLRYSLEIMQRPGSDDSAHAMSMGMIERQVEHMSRLVLDMVDVARLMIGGFRLKLQALDLNTVLTDAVEMSRPAIDSRGHALDVRISGDPVWMDGDPVRLTQVFVNLLGNAAKYTEPGGTISLSLTHTSASSERGEEAVVRVEDTGVGLAPETLSTIFEPFVRLGRDTNDLPDGFGIGLALARTFVALHHGRVSARSDGEGRGSEFIVVFPLGARGAAQGPTPAS